MKKTHLCAEMNRKQISGTEKIKTKILPSKLKGKTAKLQTGMIQRECLICDILSYFGFEDWNLDLIVSVPDHYLPFLF